MAKDEKTAAVAPEDAPVSLVDITETVATHLHPQSDPVPVSPNLPPVDAAGNPVVVLHTPQAKGEEPYAPDPVIRPGHEAV